MPQHNLEQTIALLERTPPTLNALLRDLPAEWTLCNEGENTWNAYDVVGHLIHGDTTDWIPRAKIILEFGETRRFDPFDREGHAKFVKGKTLAQLLDEFAELRKVKVAELRALKLSPEALDRRGKHPSLGTVTLSQLLATWAAHDLTHLHQISRIMACQYHEAVGPWAVYLGVMKCQGHSS